ncbi:NAD(P)-dependent alcohol dehydrogenase [Actinosynnema sp. NPDC002837]
MRVVAAIVHTKGGPFRLREVDLEPPRPREVLVRMSAVGICHTDLRNRDTWPGHLLPMVFGHEGTGSVEAVGTAVSHVEVGDTVCLSYNSCGECHSCLNGHPAYCGSLGLLNSSGGRSDGSSPLSRLGEVVHAGYFGQSSFATHAIVHERTVVRVPPDLPPLVAAPLGCSVQTGVGTVLNVLRAQPGTAVLVFGAGSVGMSAVMGARIAGCSPIIVVEPSPTRRGLALELGATAAFDPTETNLVTTVEELTSGGAHCAVDTTGRSDAVRQAIAMLRSTGRVALVGAGTDLSLDITRLQSRGISAQGVIEGDAVAQEFLPKLVEFHRGGQLPVERLTTPFAFEEIEDAAQAALAHRVLKPVLMFE